ncbi:MAG: hypothetical protein WCP93_02800 [Candidatus Berkelbacteria bacterium]
MINKKIKIFLTKVVVFCLLFMTGFFINPVKVSAATSSITVSKTILSTDLSYDNTDLTISGTGVVVTISGHHKFNSLTIQNNATLTHAALVAADFDTNGNLLAGVTSQKVVDLTIVGNLKLVNGGKINVDGKGYPGGAIKENGKGPAGGSGKTGVVASASATGGKILSKDDYGSGGGGVYSKTDNTDIGVEPSDFYTQGTLIPGTYTLTKYTYNQVVDYCHPSYWCSYSEYDFNLHTYVDKFVRDLPYSQQESACEQYCRNDIVYKGQLAYTSKSTGTGNCPADTSIWIGNTRYDSQICHQDTNSTWQDVVVYALPKTWTTSHIYSQPSQITLFINGGDIIKTPVETSSVGGAGGGRIKLDIGGSISVDATSSISANGVKENIGNGQSTPTIGSYFYTYGSGEYYPPQYGRIGSYYTVGPTYKVTTYSGAGAGGSVFIKAAANTSPSGAMSVAGGNRGFGNGTLTATLSGNANIQAKGGDGTSPDEWNGGKGGFIDFINNATPPIVNLTATPTEVKNNSISYLSWTSSGAISCVSDWPVANTPQPLNSSSGSPSGFLTAAKTFTLTCVNSAGISASDSKTVTVDSVVPVATTSSRAIRVFVGWDENGLPKVQEFKSFLSSKKDHMPDCTGMIGPLVVNGLYYCIDKNISSNYPSWGTADANCANQSKDLCSEQELEQACTNKTSNNTTGWSGVMEWTNQEVNPNLAVVATSPACGNTGLYSKDQTQYNVGYRCCKR